MREPGRPRGCAGDLLDVREPGIVGVEALGQEVAEAQDGGEHVVEVVRDSAGQAADRLEPKTLLQVLLGAAALGQVEDDSGKAKWRARGGVRHQAAHRHDPVHATVRPDDPVLRGVGCVLPERALPALERGAAVLGMNRLEPPLRVSDSSSRMPNRARARASAELSPVARSCSQVPSPAASSASSSASWWRRSCSSTPLFWVRSLSRTREAQEASLAVVHAGSGDRAPESGPVLPHQPAIDGEAAAPGGLGQVRLRGAGLAGVGG